MDMSAAAEDMVASASLTLTAGSDGLLPGPVASGGSEQLEQSRTHMSPAILVEGGTQSTKVRTHSGYDYMRIETRIYSGYHHGAHDQFDPGSSQK